MGRPKGRPMERPTGRPMGRPMAGPMGRPMGHKSDTRYIKSWQKKQGRRFLAPPCLVEAAQSTPQTKVEEAICRDPMRLAP